jgi:chromosome partitioning protein
MKNYHSIKQKEDWQMQTISIISLKGGVAKTTTAVNMAYTLAEVHKKKVLVIDNDKQGNASKAFNRYDTEDTNTIARVMLQRNVDVSEVIKRTDYEGIDIITANMDLLEANLRTVVDTGRQQQTRFKKALGNAKVGEVYDYCIIDNAPDINMSIINALVMSNDVILPIFMDQYSFDGLNILLNQIAQVQEDFNENLKFAGCLITQYQNNDVNNQGIEWLKDHKVPLFRQWIRRTERKVNESTFAKMPLVEYSARCGAAYDYKKFVLEYLEGKDAST